MKMKPVAKMAALAMVASVLAVGAPSASAQQTCFGRAVTIFAQPGVETIGTSGNDVIMGTSGPDVIRGRGGNDRICGLGGDDRLFGNGGNDRIKGGSGADNIRGGPGADRIRGGGGNDTIRGQGGADDIKGQGGRDSIQGGGGSDDLNGGGANDVLRGGKGNDGIIGGSGTDICSGDGGQDLPGNDCELFPTAEDVVAAVLFSVNLGDPVPPGSVDATTEAGLRSTASSFGLFGRETPCESTSPWPGPVGTEAHCLNNAGGFNVMIHAGRASTGSWVVLSFTEVGGGA